jgi:Flp pilus assembly protein TadD
MMRWKKSTWKLCNPFPETLRIQADRHFAIRPLKEKAMRFSTFQPVAAFSFAAALVFAGALPGALAADTPTEPTPAAAPAKIDRMASGRAAIKSADWKKAISEFSAAVKDQPGNADAHNLLAFSFRKQATPDLPKAFEHYNTALKLNPNHKGAHEYIGEAYLMDKQPAKAEEHLARLKTICGGTACEEYDDLAKSLAAYKAKNK